MATRAQRYATAARRWAFLREWIGVLQEHLYYHEREELAGGTLHSGLRSFCVYIPWPPAATDEYEHKLTRLREAMELVALALRLDRAAWLLVAKAGNAMIEDFDPDDYDDGDLTPRYMVKAYARDKDPIDTLRSIGIVRRLLCKDDLVPRRAAYSHARRKVISMDARGVLTGFQARVSILFTPKRMADSAIASYLATAQDIVDKTHGAIATGLPFALTSIVFHPWEWMLNERRAESIQAFVESTLKRGVEIPELAIQFNASVPVATGRLLHAICLPNANARGHAAKVDALMVANTSRAPFVAMCSALASTRTLSRLLLYTTMGRQHTRSEKWHALGVALLSCASTTSVHELYIQEDTLLISDATAFQRAAESLHPLYDIYASEWSQCEQDPVDRFVMLCEDAKIKFTHEGEELGLSQLQLSAASRFFVVDDQCDTEWMHVLAPAYGVVLTRCEDVVGVAGTSDDRSDARSRGRLTQLHIACDDCEPGALTMFITTVSWSLLSLDITVKHARLIRAGDVRTILSTCLQLKLLRLECANLGSMDVITDAYAQGHCQIASLSLKNVHVSNSSLQAFAKTLADPTHRLATVLIEFRYMSDAASYPDATGVQLFLDMLAANATLSFLEIGLCDSLYEEFAAAFRDRDNRLLVSHPTDLPLSAKLAFLSCVRVSSRRRQKCYRPDVPTTATTQLLSLPQRLVERIFFLARKRIYRVVSAIPFADDSAKPAIM